MKFSWPRYYKTSNFSEVDYVLEFLRFHIIYAKKINRSDVVWCRVFQIEVY